MPDLVLVVPSRGRPANVERLVRACVLTCQADTRLHFGFDNDDEHLEANIAAAGGHRYVVGPRMGLTDWTNDLARRNIKRADAPYLGSVGDDMVPITGGWDVQLIDAIKRMGGTGAAYPNDMRRDDIPEAIVMSADVVAEFGWMAHPTLRHWFIDNVWRDIFNGAGCLTYKADVLVRHDHPTVTGEPGDRTYSDAARHYPEDLRAYQRWRLRYMRADVATVARVRAKTPDPL